MREGIALQVQTIFNPIENIADLAHRSQVRFESRSIMAMALEGINPLEMNAFLDTSCISGEKMTRMLDVVSIGHQKNSDAIIVELKLTRGTNKGTIFRVSLFCKELDEIYQDREKLKIEILQDRREKPEMTHGLIARGDPGMLVENLKKDILEKDGSIKKENI